MYSAPDSAQSMAGKEFLDYIRWTDRKGFLDSRNKLIHPTPKSFCVSTDILRPSYFEIECPSDFLTFGVISRDSAPHFVIGMIGSKSQVYPSDTRYLSDYVGLIPLFMVSDRENNIHLEGTSNPRQGRLAGLKQELLFEAEGLENLMVKYNRIDINTYNLYKEPERSYRRIEQKTEEALNGFEKTEGKMADDILIALLNHFFVQAAQINEPTSAELVDICPLWDRFKALLKLRKNGSMQTPSHTNHMQLESTSELTS